MPSVKNCYDKTKFAFFESDGLDDTHLSLAAKGLLAYILAKPSEWEANVTDIEHHTIDGKTIIYRVLQELRHFGYVTYLTIRDEKTNQILDTQYNFYVRPSLNPAREDPITIPLSKKHQGTDKRKAYKGGKITKKPRSENLNALETSGNSPDSEILKAGKPLSEFLNLEILNDNKNILLKEKKNKEEYTTFFSTLKSQIGDNGNYATWIVPVQFTITGNVLDVAVPEEFFIGWLKNHYEAALIDAAKQQTHLPDVQLRYRVAEQEESA